ncbi:GNAT family N-acetyltransferase [Lentibacter sp.]|uniref:GNAT family N-acetyltransferase n=1 Tax=Lentibacter sp. TaxID=2024994 RepID=UPI003F6B99AA
MKSFNKGSYHVRIASSEADVRRAQALRHLAFYGRTGRDCDAFDERAHHILIETGAGQVVGCFRLMDIADEAQILASYSAQFYGLEPLRAQAGPLLELGRFCIAPGVRDPDVVRVAWAALTRYVDEKAIKTLFGCASFAGVEPAAHADSMALLKARYLGPEALRPHIKAQAVYRFDEGAEQADFRRGLAQMPGLLRSYIAMGGWVSDHAVIDHDMNRLHVFTALDVARMPEGRKRLLRVSAA